MKRSIRSLAVCLLLAAVTLPACAQGSDLFKNRFHVRKSYLFRGTSPYVLCGLETPDLMNNGPGLAALVPTLNAVCAVGGDTICFNLDDLLEDGVLPEARATEIRESIGQITWRRLGIVCRLFGPDAPADQAYRLAAVKSVAKQLRTEVRMIYWIEGPDCPALVKAMKDDASMLVTAAACDEADILVVTDEPEDDPDKPVLLAGKLPQNPRGRTHYLLPPGDASLERIDKALAHPFESAPWTPDNSLLTPEEREAGFIALFNGKNFDGWRITGSERGWAIEDGAIVWQRRGGGVILSRDRYADFILRIEWKIAKNGNSGIFLHAPRAGRQSKVGMEFQLHGDPGAPPEKHGTGAIYDVLAPLCNPSKPIGAWNQLEVAFKGPHLKAVLNGEVVQDVNFDDHEELKYRLRNGFIGLQDHGCEVCFRNIRIKRL